MNGRILRDVYDECDYNKDKMDTVERINDSQIIESKVMKEILIGVTKIIDIFKMIIITH